MTFAKPLHTGRLLRLWVLVAHDRPSGTFSPVARGEASHSAKRHSASATRDGEPQVHPSAALRDAKLGRFTEIKERVQFMEFDARRLFLCRAAFGSDLYDHRQILAIASDVRINALDHPMERVSQHKITYRPNEYFLGAKLDKELPGNRVEDARRDRP